MKSKKVNWSTLLFTLGLLILSILTINFVNKATAMPEPGDLVEVGTIKSNEGNVTLAIDPDSGLEYTINGDDIVEPHKDENGKQIKGNTKVTKKSFDKFGDK